MTDYTNPRYRLAPRTSSQTSAPSVQNGFKTSFNGITEWLDRRPLMQLLTALLHPRRTCQSQKAFSQSPNGIQSP
jgi:hypothetical protein